MEATPKEIDCPFCEGKLQCVKPGQQYHCDMCDWWLVWHPEPILKIDPDISEELKALTAGWPITEEDWNA